MSDTDEYPLDSFDSDSSDEWQDYFTDQGDEALDDNGLPPVIVNEEKYKSDQCSICFKDLDKDIGTPDTCVHMFCLKCITLWSETSKTCPLDGRKFSQIVEFVKREGKILYQHKKDVKISCGEKDVKISCGKPDLQPQSPQRPRCIHELLLFSCNCGENLPDPVWHRRNQNYELPGLDFNISELLPWIWFQQESSQRSSIFELPVRRRIQQERSKSSIFPIPMQPRGVDENISEFGFQIGRRVRRNSENRGFLARSFRRCIISQYLKSIEILNKNIFEEYSSKLENCSYCKILPVENIDIQDSFAGISKSFDEKRRLYCIKHVPSRIQNLRIRGNLDELLPSEVD